MCTDDLFGARFRKNGGDKRNARPHPGPLPAERGKRLAVELAIGSLVDSKVSGRTWPEGCPNVELSFASYSFSPGEKVRMRASQKNSCK